MNCHTRRLHVCNLRLRACSSNRTLTCSKILSDFYLRQRQRVLRNSRSEGYPMLKAILAGTTALVIAGSSLVYAQQRQGRPEFGRGQPNVEDMRAFAEARLGALRAGLMLTPEQERNWPAFEQAAREFAMQRLARVNAFVAARRERQQRNDLDPTERLRRRAEILS